jgi:hypothetical protein
MLITWRNTEKYGQWFFCVSKINCMVTLFKGQLTSHPVIRNLYSSEQSIQYLREWKQNKEVDYESTAKIAHRDFARLINQISSSNYSWLRIYVGHPKLQNKFISRMLIHILGVLITKQKSQSSEVTLWQGRA